MRKKKNGSTLVSILAITIVLLSLAGIILSSTIKTTQLNGGYKDEKDLEYAAESGIEIARSYFTTSNGQDGKIDTKNNLNDKKLVKELEKGIVKEVNVTSIEDPNDSNKIIVTSEAIHEDTFSKKVVKCKLKRGNKGIGNIFDYGAVAGQGEINIGVNGSSSANSDMAASGNINVSNSTGKQETISMNKLDFINSEFIPNMYIIHIRNTDKDYIWQDSPKYAFYKENNNGDYENIEITDLEMNIGDNFVRLKTNGENNKNINLDDLSKLENKMNAVIRLRINGASPYGITILFTNTNKLELKLNDDTLKLTSYIWLNKGSLNMNESGVLELTRSTLYSSDINISEKGSFKIDGESGDPENKDYNTGHCIPRDKFNRLNEIIGKIIKGWNNNTGSSGQLGGFELDENPYS